jgi:L-serine dehydratase
VLFHPVAARRKVTEGMSPTLMHTSLFDLFKIGIGPSSSHTVGPMRAAHRFAERLSNHGLLKDVSTVRVELFGSLALTGLGHGTDRGVLLGLMGKQPDEIHPAEIEGLIAGIRKSGLLTLFGRHTIPFGSGELTFNKDELSRATRMACGLPPRVLTARPLIRASTTP